MSLFKNKHVVVALLVAPILAVLSYFAVDALVSETPESAEAGQSYPLVEKPNCRYDSGACDLKNSEVEIRIVALEQTADSVLFQLTSTVPVQGARVALAGADGQTQLSEPQVMLPGAEEGSLQLRMQRPDPQQHRLQLVVSINGSFYFADVATRFIEYKTSFEKDFRQ